MTDKILEMFFEPKRWEYAIEKGVYGGIIHRTIDRKEEGL